MKKILMVSVLAAVVVSVVAFDYFGKDNRVAVVNRGNKAVMVSSIALPMPVAHKSPVVVPVQEVASVATKADKQEAATDVYSKRMVRANYRPFLEARQTALLKRNAALTNENTKLGNANFELAIAKANTGKALAIANELQSSQMAALR